MDAHGLRRDEQCLADLSVRPPFGELAEYIGLAFGQAEIVAVGTGRATCMLRGTPWRCACKLFSEAAGRRSGRAAEQWEADGERIRCVAAGSCLCGQAFGETSSRVGTFRHRSERVDCLDGAAP